MKEESFAAFLPGIRQRWLDEQRGWQLRRARAWTSARDAADALRRRGATRVIAFGSMVRTGRFDERSDIDLAEQGIEPGSFWRASAEAARLVRDFELDVIDLADCPAQLREAILREGVPI